VGLLFPGWDGLQLSLYFLSVVSALCLLLINIYADIAFGYLLIGPVDGLLVGTNGA
jgi:hypothetical protein